MNRLKYSLVVAFLFSTAELWAGELKLNFEYDVAVSIPSPSGLSLQKKYNENEEVILNSSEVYWLESKGKVPVLVVPNGYSKKEPMKISLVDAADWPSNTTQKVIDTKMSTMLDLMTQFQAQLAKKNVGGAEEILNRMASVADLSVLDIFRAYLAYLKGDIEKAKTTVKRALIQHPENAQGQELLKSLEGKK